MNRNLDLATLRTLLMVAETGGMTKAANKLNLTQSTVSMQMKRLEDQLDKSILQRQGRVMRVTNDGDKLLSYAKRLLELNDEAWDQLTVPRHEGSLRFGVPHDIVHPHIPGLLRRFVQSHPRVAVKLSTDMTAPLLEEYDRSGYDIILTTEINPQGSGEVLLRKPLVWSGAVNGRAWRQRPLPLAFSKTCSFRGAVLNSLDSHGIEWVDTIELGSNFDSGSLACAADLGIRGDIEGFSTDGMEAIEDPDNTLPELPEYSIVMYVADGPNKSITDEFSEMLRAGFATVHPDHMLCKAV